MKAVLMINNHRFLYLLTKYKEGTCSGDEYDEFFSLLLTNDFDELVKENIAQDFSNDNSSLAELPPHIAQEIVRNVLSADQKVHHLVPLKGNRYKRIIKWVAAACIFAVISVASFFYFNNAGEKVFASIIPEKDILKENKDRTPLKINLPDGTAVLLQPDSKIHYPAEFVSEQREVYLEGDAHFDVTHNPSKPFFVYCNDIVTKVLGTSFDVQTNEKNGDVEVAVKSGRVQVYENEALLHSSSDIKPVILTANQRVVYSSAAKKITSTLVEKPILLINKPITIDSLNLTKNIIVQLPSKPSFVYDQATLNTVFDDIQKAYGIDVVVENTNINNCVFTGDVSDKDLFVLLKIICLSTNADYEVMGTKILIKGKGCNP